MARSKQVISGVWPDAVGSYRWGILTCCGPCPASSTTTTVQKSPTPRGSSFSPGYTAADEGFGRRRRGVRMTLMETFVASNDLAVRHHLTSQFTEQLVHPPESLSRPLVHPLEPFVETLLSPDKPFIDLIESPGEVPPEQRPACHQQCRIEPELEPFHTVILQMFTASCNPWTPVGVTDYRRCLGSGGPFYSYLVNVFTSSRSWPWTSMST